MKARITRIQEYDAMIIPKPDFSNLCSANPPTFVRAKSTGIAADTPKLSIRKRGLSDIRKLNDPYDETETKFGTIKPLAIEPMKPIILATNTIAESFTNFFAPSFNTILLCTRCLGNIG